MANREQKRKMNKKTNGSVKKVETPKNKKGFLEKKLGLTEEMASFVKTLIIVVISFLVILCLTLLFGKLGLFEEGYTKPTNEETVISYEEILIGSVFNRNSSEYYVIFDNFGDKTADQYLNQKISTYTSLPIYKVDMTKGINKNYLSDASNYYATKASELKIKNPTLIKITNGRNNGYFEGTENIINELFK